MKKTNLAKKGLMPAVLGAVCSVVALTSVSYAWFTMGNQSSVGEIDVNVQTAGGMQISADAEAWKTLLPVSELSAQKNTWNEWVTNTDGLLPTSTVGEYAASGENGPQRQQMFLGTINKNGELEANASDAAGNYVAFDLFIKVDKAQTLVLDEKSYVISLEKEGRKYDTDLAVRVSFADFGATQLTAADARNLNSVGDVKIWEPNANKHTDEVVKNGKISQGAYETTFKGVSGVGTDDIAVTTALEKDMLFSTDYAADGKITSQYELFQLETGINKVRIYIWLEGQDVDCVNSISSGKFGVGLNFAITDAKQPAEPTEE